MKVVVAYLAVVCSALTAFPALSAELRTEANKAVTAESLGTPPSGKGRVVFYRVSRHADGYGSSCTIHERTPDKDVAFHNIKGNRYRIEDFDPGVHEFAVKIETTDRLRIEVEPDEIYFVQCVMTNGVLRARPDIRPSTLEEFMSFKKLRPDEE